jgi:hypothetical protein
MGLARIPHPSPCRNIAKRHHNDMKSAAWNALGGAFYLVMGFDLANGVKGASCPI